MTFPSARDARRCGPPVEHSAGCAERDCPSLNSSEGRPQQGGTSHTCMQPNLLFLGVLDWTGACYWHGVGGIMFNSSSSSAPPRRKINPPPLKTIRKTRQANRHENRGIGPPLPSEPFARALGAMECGPTAGRGKSVSSRSIPFVSPRSKTKRKPRTRAGATMQQGRACPRQTHTTTSGFVLSLSPYSRRPPAAARHHHPNHLQPARRFVARSTPTAAARGPRRSPPPLFVRGRGGGGGGDGGGGGGAGRALATGTEWAGLCVTPSSSSGGGDGGGGGGGGGVAVRELL